VRLTKYLSNTLQEAKLDTIRDSRTAVFLTYLLANGANTKREIRTENVRNDIFSWEFSDAQYCVRLARNADEVKAALRLRFEVFNLELGEGLESSHLTGLDKDRFDEACHHLIVIERETDNVIGTYRLQTFEMTGGKIENFYCAGEFRLEDLPFEFLRESLEIGRASIAVAHRHTKVLFLLWKGLAAYLEISRKRYLFGCCSLTSQNVLEGWKAMQSLVAVDALEQNLWIAPRENHICESNGETLEQNNGELYKLPKLFSTYLRFGAKVCSPPAIDREYKTIDFFVVFDSSKIDEKIRRMFFM